MKNDFNLFLIGSLLNFKNSYCKQKNLNTGGYFISFVLFYYEHKDIYINTAFTFLFLHSISYASMIILPMTYGEGHDKTNS